MALFKKKFKDVSKDNKLFGNTESDEKYLNIVYNNEAVFMTTSKNNTLSNSKAKMKQRITSRKVRRRTALVKHMKKNSNPPTNATFLNLQKCGKNPIVNTDQLKVKNTSQKKNSFNTKRVRFSDVNLVLKPFADGTEQTKKTKHIIKAVLSKSKNVENKSNKAATWSNQINREAKQFKQNGMVQHLIHTNQHVQKISRPISSRFTALECDQKVEKNSTLLNQQRSDEKKCRKSNFCQHIFKEIYCNINDKKVTIALDVRGFSLNDVFVSFHQGKLIITAKKNLKTEYGYSLYQIRRAYVLPVGVQKFKIFTKIINDGMLIIQCIPDEFSK
ncbi:uncharacterized protein LOC124810798 [Hydra vulgaris]|uniref:uncharacterized protein LOC124810798 n=1 Tax=Hydra vulgaris TaxID=6087 RepID=UPI001F5E79F7|nr:uncharacterized protein LOC124810798 [Hydra vulgaris]